MILIFDWFMVNIFEDFIEIKWRFKNKLIKNFYKVPFIYHLSAYLLVNFIKNFSLKLLFTIVKELIQQFNW